MVDGNLAMANDFVNATEQQTSYWTDVNILFTEMDRNTCKYPLPMCFNENEEQKELNRRELRLRGIAERYIQMKYYRN
jgi:hypothetical protein